MFQIRFRLGLRPRPRWGSLSASPNTVAELKGLYTSKGREGLGDDNVGRGGKRKVSPSPSPQFQNPETATEFLVMSLEALSNYQTFNRFSG